MGGSTAEEDGQKDQVREAFEEQCGDRQGREVVGEVGLGDERR